MFVRNIGSTGLRVEYADIVHDILAQPTSVSPRGAKTREILNYVLVLDDPTFGTFPTGISRGVKPALLAAEMMQWVGGVSDLAQLKSVTAEFGNFSGDQIRLYGAYGPRTYRGMRRAVRLLADDPDSRQATVSIWSNLEADKTFDLPCTVSWSFVIRDHPQDPERRQLHMTTYMRSNDVWKGVAYDVPIMCRIQTMMAWAFGVDTGTYTHHAQSMHLYESDWDLVDGLTTPRGSAREPPFFNSMDHPSHDPLIRWDAVTFWARRALRGESVVPPFDWYAKRLEGTDHFPHFCEGCRYWLPQVEMICPAG